MHGHLCIRILDPFQATLVKSGILPRGNGLEWRCFHPPFSTAHESLERAAWQNDNSAGAARNVSYAWHRCCLDLRRLFVAPKSLRQYLPKVPQKQTGCVDFSTFALQIEATLSEIVVAFTLQCLTDHHCSASL